MPSEFLVRQMTLQAGELKRGSEGQQRQREKQREGDREGDRKRKERQSQRGMIQ